MLEASGFPSPPPYWLCLIPNFIPPPKDIQMSEFDGNHFYQLLVFHTAPIVFLLSPMMHHQSQSVPTKDVKISEFLKASSFPRAYCVPLIPNDASPSEPPTVPPYLSLPCICQGRTENSRKWAWFEIVDLAIFRGIPKKIR